MRGRKSGLLAGEKWKKIHIPSTTHKRILEVSELTGIPIHGFCGMSLMKSVAEVLRGMSDNQDYLFDLVKEYSRYMRFRHSGGKLIEYEISLPSELGGLIKLLPKEISQDSEDSQDSENSGDLGEESK